MMSFTTIIFLTYLIYFLFWLRKFRNHFDLSFNKALLKTYEVDASVSLQTDKTVPQLISCNGSNEFRGLPEPQTSKLGIHRESFVINEMKVKGYF